MELETDRDRETEPERACNTSLKYVTEVSTDK